MVFLTLVAEVSLVVIPLTPNACLLPMYIFGLFNACFSNILLREVITLTAEWSNAIEETIYVCGVNECCGPTILATLRRYLC